MYVNCMLIPCQKSIEYIIYAFLASQQPRCKQLGIKLATLQSSGIQYMKSIVEKKEDLDYGNFF